MDNKFLRVKVIYGIDIFKETINSSGVNPDILMPNSRYYLVSNYVLFSHITSIRIFYNMNDNVIRGLQ